MKTKQNIPLKAFFILLFFFSQGLLPNSLYAQTTAIPDANFEQALIDLEIDSDGIINGQVLTSDIDTVIALDINHKSILDLTGIEDFTALEYLDVGGNELTILDVSNNIQLKELYSNSSSAGFSMLFTSLDLSNNVNLELLYGENLIFLESLNLKNENNSILTSVTLPCEFEGEPCELTGLNCVTVDDEVAATNNEPPYSNWYIQADYFYSEDCILSISDNSLSDIFIHPNPVKDILSFNNTSTTQIESIKIYDVLGRLVFQVDEQLKNIDVSKLNSGLLFVKIETTQGGVTKKVMKK